MLVLRRRTGERILIGNDISVMVLEVQGDRVKLGFQCPRQVRVLREELQWRPTCRAARRCEPELAFAGEYL